MHLFRAYPEVLREPQACRVHPFASFGGGAKAVVGLHLQAAVIFSQAVDYRGARVRTAGVLEESLSGQRLFGKSWKLAADEVEIEFHQPMMASSRYACQSQCAAGIAPYGSGADTVRSTGAAHGAASPARAARLPLAGAGAGGTRLRLPGGA